MSTFTKEIAIEALQRQVEQLLRLAFGSEALSLLEDAAWTRITWAEIKARYPQVVTVNTCDMMDLEESLLLFQEKFHKLNLV